MAQTADNKVETITDTLDIIELVWSILEQHWNGALLVSRQTVLRLASTMAYNGFWLLIRFIETLYPTGVRLCAQAMSALEIRLQRLTELEKWFVRITPLCC